MSPQSCPWFSYDCHSEKLQEVGREGVKQRGELRWAEDDEVVDVTIGWGFKLAEGNREQLRNCLEGVDTPAVAKSEKRGLEESPSLALRVPRRNGVALWLIPRELVVRVPEVDLGEDWDETRFEE